MKTAFHLAETDGSVRSVTRALAILRALGKEGRSLTEISRIVGISASTASRLLNTLVAQEFVANTADNKYVAGLGLTSLLYSTDQWAPLRRVARAAAETLRTELNETAAFFVRTGHERLCIEVAESTQAVRRICLPGERRHLFLGAAGKTLLAFEKHQTDIWSELFVSDNRFKTVTGSVRTAARLKRECVEICRQGYASSSQESNLESWAIGAPIYIHEKFVGALSVVIPLTRYSDAFHSQVVKATKSVARQYSDPGHSAEKATDSRPTIRSRRAAANA